MCLRRFGFSGAAPEPVASDQRMTLRRTACSTISAALCRSSFSRCGHDGSRRRSRVDSDWQRHCDVEDRDIALQQLRLPNRLPAIARFGNHFAVGALLEHFAQALPHDRVIVGEQDPKPCHQLATALACASNDVPAC